MQGLILFEFLGVPSTDLLPNWEMLLAQGQVGPDLIFFLLEDGRVYAHPVIDHGEL